MGRALKGMDLMIKLVIILQLIMVVRVDAFDVQNGKIAFTSDRDGNRDIYIMTPDGSGLRRLTDNPGWDDHASFSPNGRQIAYVSESGGHYFIKTMNASGSGKTTVAQIDINFSTTNFCGERFALDWSPDGSKIMFQEFGDIITIRTDGTDRQNITNSLKRESEPCWGPFAGVYAFTSPKPSNPQPDAGLWIHLSTSAYTFGDFGYYTCSVSPDISRDGTKLAYVSGHDLVPPGYIYIADIEKADIRFLDLNDVMNVRWSPDGHLLVFESISSGFSRQIETIDEFGQGRRVLTEGTNPSWGLGRPVPIVLLDDNIARSSELTGYQTE